MSYERQIGGRRGVGSRLWRLIRAAPSVAVFVVVGLLATGGTRWLLDQYLGQLRSMVAFYLGGSTLVGFTPRGMFLAPATAVAVVATAVGLVVGGFVVVRRYDAVRAGRRATWTTEAGVVFARLRAAVTYLLVTAAVTLVGLALLVVPGLYAFARLSAGIPAVLDGQSVRASLEASLADTRDDQLALTAWIAGIAACVVAVAVAFGTWVAVPVGVATLAAFSVGASG